MKAIFKRILPFLDFFLVPFVYPAAWLLKNIRKAGVHRLPLCKSALLQVGVFPIRDHYYEPRFNMRQLKTALTKERTLLGIDWNITEQLAILDKLVFAAELQEMPIKKDKESIFYFDNPMFKSGDAEYWYQLIRWKKPKRIIEVGSGYSTLLAINAIKKNQTEDITYQCEHSCIEPYEVSWLDDLGLTVIRKPLEELPISFFTSLAEDDLLFVDSSHIIRPQGDVLFIYLELLPILNKGVIVHIHDIFSPRDYLTEWLVQEVVFWNEQYLLEAFLCQNHHWKIIAALNYLHHNYYAQLKAVCPFLSPTREPGSFYLQKR